MIIVKVVIQFFKEYNHIKNELMIDVVTSKIYTKPFNSQ